jgi:subfamily B ATP-binding cassette protein MsbA
MFSMTHRPNNLRRFLAYAKPYWRRMVFSTVIGVTKYNLPVVFPWILKEAVDGVLSGKPGRLGLDLDPLMGAALLLFAVYALTCHLRTYIADHLAQESAQGVTRAIRPPPRPGPG